MVQKSMELWIPAPSAVGHDLYHMGERVIGDQADILEHDTMGAIKGVLCTSKRLISVRRISFI